MDPAKKALWTKVVAGFELTAPITSHEPRSHNG